MKVTLDEAIESVDRTLFGSSKYQRRNKFRYVQDICEIAEAHSCRSRRSIHVSLRRNGEWVVWWGLIPFSWNVHRDLKYALCHVPFEFTLKPYGGVQAIEGQPFSSPAREPQFGMEWPRKQSILLSRRPFSVRYSPRRRRWISRGVKHELLGRALEAATI